MIGVEQRQQERRKDWLRPGHGAPADDLRTGQAWKVLIVDDEEDVHRVTEFALDDFELHGRGLSFLHAYTGREAVEVMRREPDVALILMDVVMESEHAGLDAVNAIRSELGNRFVRIVLRTGQPGQAPEREVVRKFDINDYKEKTDLTATKLFTLIHTGLNHYRELVAMEQARVGLERVIDASTSIFELQSLTQFARGVLQQLTALLYARRATMVVRAAGVAASKRDSEDFRILAGSGEYAGFEGRLAPEVLDDEALRRIERAIGASEPQVNDRHFTAHFPSKSGIEHVVYLTSDASFEPSDMRLVELFCRNVAIAFENLDLHQEVLDSQRQIILMLSAAIEERSRELRNHVQRVSEYAVLLGSLHGLSEHDLDRLGVAAAMHDLGKIAIPESILNKPGILTDEERATMEQHVERGLRMLTGQHGTLLGASSIVIGEHHERWDGAGYPRRLTGEQIHLFGRIACVADVFDALTTRRCYKEAWPIERVREYFLQERGGQFDPGVVDLFMGHFDDFLKIKARLYDNEVAATAF